ncbi:DUF3857 and transglutaminase domain-containing protein [Hymenobacter sp. DH14]|uniref:DUF3857 and transglutaminase domain-containing protein n=1 Tax=Hymenobacter cyanobacteriorum TaxID=2926463 RepID=A0A9X2AHH2_9BACT|nr:DUF3857 and transglutaminase domain-containing protein [Hymenobacter cyanobacteriorum]MCI1188843.1 DUF3857 and transglutaminase domain-containing protein [Hymenobacter cyanobacteriorum]
MKKLLPWLAVALAPTLFATRANAQAAPIKFGQIDPKDLTAAPFVGDSAAAAVVLCDFGTSSFQYNHDNFQLMSERTTRIKILKKAGYEAAKVEIPLYHHGDRTEKITALRGVTYNLVDGKVVKTKLETGTNAFTEERTPNVRVRKFTLPDVREGTVIEYTYAVTSDFFFNFQNWTFQSEYPVRWSEFRASIPEYFHYSKQLQGYHNLDISTEDNSSQALMVSPVVGPPTPHMVNVQTTNSRWVMKDLPAFRDEPFMTTATDYVDRISFQLDGVQFPGQVYQAMAGTWAKVESELLNDDDFGQQLGRGNFLKEQVLPLVAKYPDVRERAAAVRALVMGSVRYDGTNRYSTTASLRKAYDAHHGTAADVNLLLIAALRDAGIPAHPLLLSTRAHGRLNQSTPLLDNFNYVVGLVPLGAGQDLLVDATEPLLPCGVLPERCLNQAGRLIMKNPAESRWVDLTPAQRYVHYQQVALTLDAQGGLSGKVHEEHGGYSGVDARKELVSLGEKKYLTELARPHSGWTIPKLAVANREEVAKPLALDYEFSQPADDAAVAGTLYLSPLRYFGTEQNPFRHDDRLFPVDFGAAQDETTLITLTLPEGYELAELPKPAAVALPDDGGRFMYSVTAAAPGTVQIMSRLNLRKTVYAANEYVSLREFYRLMLEKQGEKLVIKKKA